MDLIKYFICFISALLAVLAIAHSECTLETLYKDRPRQSMVRTRLTELFEHRFNRAVDQAQPHSRYLIPAATHFKKDLKKYFIDHGDKLSSLHDLEILLKRLNYTQVPLFKAYKEDIEKFGTDLVID